MPPDRPSGCKLTPKDVFGYIEKTLGRRERRHVEQHLDECPDCVAYVASVLRSKRAPAENEDEILDQLPARRPEEILDRLRPRIVATSPGTSRRSGRGWAWRQWAPAAAAAAGLLVAFGLVQRFVISPQRGRQLATRAMADLVTLRQGTGRIPLRYIAGFERARVTRSSFDALDPAEDHIEAQLRRAAELAPRQAESQLALGLFLLDQGGLDQAEAQFQLVLKIEPESIAAKNGLAIVWYERALRDPSRAQGFLRKGLSLLRDARRGSADDPMVTFNLGMFYQQLGSEGGAKRAWSDYLELDPDSEWAEVATEKLEALGVR